MGTTNLLRQVQNLAAHGTAGSFVNPKNLGSQPLKNALERVLFISR